MLTRSLGVRRSIVAHTGLELYAPLPFPLARRLSRRMLSRKALRLALIYSPGAADGGERAEHGALEAEQLDEPSVEVNDEAHGYSGMAS